MTPPSFEKAPGAVACDGVELPCAWSVRQLGTRVEIGVCVRLGRQEYFGLALESERYESLPVLQSVRRVFICAVGFENALPSFQIHGTIRRILSRPQKWVET